MVLIVVFVVNIDVKQNRGYCARVVVYLIEMYVMHECQSVFHAL